MKTRSRHRFLFRIISICFLLLWLRSDGLKAQKNMEEVKISNRKFPSIKTDSVAIYLDSAQKMSPSNSMRAVTMINRAIELCIRSNDRNREALAYLALGNIQQNLGQHGLAIENYQRAIRASSLDEKKRYDKEISSFAANATNTNTLFHAHVQMAESQLEIAQNESALVNLDIALMQYSGNLPGNELNEAGRLKARVLIQENQTNKAIQLLQDILSKEQNAGNMRGQAETLYRLGDGYAKMGDHALSNQYYTQAKDIADRNNFAELSVAANNALALYYRFNGELDKEIQVRQSNIALNQQYNNGLAVSMENIEIGNAYLRNNEVEKAETFFRQGLDAMNNANGAPVDFQSVDEPVFMQYKSARFKESAEGFLKLAEGFYEKSNFQKAIEYYTLYSQLQDSLELAREEELARAISLSANIGKNQQRLELLEKETVLNDRSIGILRKDQELKSQQIFTRNLIIGTMAAFIVAMLVAGLLIYRNIQARRKTDKLLALRSLTGQMNPHFIFNALNSVNEFVAAKDELAANRYLTSFSKLMRQVLDDSRRSLISLAEEIEMLSHYLKLEHARFSDKFDFVLDVAEDLDQSELFVPPMLIQPYVENAIWHGLRYKSGKGSLKIAFEKAAAGIEITISDNGIGVLKSRELKTHHQKRQSSVGMKNTEMRMQLLNELYTTGIRAEVTDLHPGSEEPGTLVKLYLPFGLEEKMNQDKEK